MRLAPVAAGVLACAAAAMVAVALASGGGGGEEEPAATPPAPAATAEQAGLAVWSEHGCGSCHTLAAAESAGRLGPNLDASLDGMPTSYVRESIVDPPKVVSPNYSAGMMPEDYASRMSPDELDALVDFIGSSAQG